MIVVGTAGHIDHGKSSIVKRLTGTDPDRLPEEKARGMTIDLGFAFYGTPDGREIAFIDVPGHERFVKNMIAGAGGIDAAMLVVAADDGWMPQSEEHFQIVQLLGVRHGLIVINKIDLAEPDWVELLAQEIRDKVKGSFLDGAPVIKVSAETGAGFDELRAWLDRLPGEIQARRQTGKARLFIDRAFVRPGMGGVVTGTLRGGDFRVGQAVAVWPSMTTGKIRTLQTHNRDVDTVSPGRRVAVSFTGIERELLVRGGVVSNRTDLTWFARYPVLALSVELLRTAAVSLENRRRVLVMVGTTEMEGEIRLANARAIPPGGRGIAFLKPDAPIYALVADRYILRLPTPMVTLGGGLVLDHFERLPRQREQAALKYVEHRLPVTNENLVLSELEKLVAARRSALLATADIGSGEIDSTITSLIAGGKLELDGEVIVHREAGHRVAEELKASLTAYFNDNPHVKGIALDAIAAMAPVPPSSLPIFLDHLVARQVLVRRAELYDLVGRGLGLKGSIESAYREIMRQLEAAPYAPPTLASLAENGKDCQQAIRYLIESAEVHKCGSEFVFLASIWREIQLFVRDRLNQAGRLSVTELRDRFGFTRKFAIPILEELDRREFTARDGDVRVKGRKFETEAASL